MFVKFCECPSFSSGIEDRTWVVIVLISDHCLSIYFVFLMIKLKIYDDLQIRHKYFES